MSIYPSLCIGFREFPLSIFDNILVILSQPVSVETRCSRRHSPCAHSPCEFKASTIIKSNSLIIKPLFISLLSTFHKAVHDHLNTIMSDTVKSCNLLSVYYNGGDED